MQLVMLHELREADLYNFLVKIAGQNAEQCGIMEMPVAWHAGGRRIIAQLPPASQ